MSRGPSIPEIDMARVDWAMFGLSVQICLSRMEWPDDELAQKADITDEEASRAAAFRPVEHDVYLKICDVLKLDESDFYQREAGW